MDNRDHEYPGSDSYTPYHERQESLTPEEVLEECDEEVLDKLEETPMKPLVRALRKTVREREGVDE
jgi:hypothetical protein